MLLTRLLFPKFPRQMHHVSMTFSKYVYQHCDSNISAPLIVLMHMYRKICKPSRVDTCRVVCLSFLLVFENKLDVLVGKGHQVSADQSHHSVQNCRLDKVHVPNPPEEPWRDNSHSLISEHAVCWLETCC